jgi:hypothetical protein
MAEGGMKFLIRTSASFRAQFHNMLPALPTPLEMSTISEPTLLRSIATTPLAPYFFVATLRSFVVETTGRCRSSVQRHGIHA